MEYFALVALVAAYQSAGEGMAHVRSEFHFAVEMPYETAAPLFGALAERKWALGWNPQFVYPTPAEDREGAVFRVEHGSHTSVWVTTVFDLPGGHVQYVSVIDRVMLTRIDIRLAKNGTGKTDVAVAYERTALDVGVNEHVRALGRSDAGQGPEWKAQIDAYAMELHSFGQQHPL